MKIGAFILKNGVEIDIIKSYIYEYAQMEKGA